VRQTERARESVCERESARMRISNIVFFYFLLGWMSCESESPSEINWRVKKIGEKVSISPTFLCVTFLYKSFAQSFCVLTF
jgi:hypothetical protein